VGRTGDHSGETSPAAPATEPVSDPALIGAIKDLADNVAALDQLIDLDAAALQQLYAGHNYPADLGSNTGLQPRGEALLSTLERLQRSGALPDSEDIAAASARRNGGAIAGLAELELLLSSALIRTAVDPQDLLAPGRVRRSWRPRRTATIRAVPASVAAARSTFWRLRAAIDGYRTMAGTAAGRA